MYVFCKTLVLSDTGPEFAPSPVLKELRQTVDDLDTCQDIWTSFDPFFRGWVREEHVCAGWNNQGEGTCNVSLKILVLLKVRTL